MSTRRFPTLIVARLTGIYDWSGMIPLTGFDFRSVCDDDLIPGSRPSILLRDAVNEMLIHAGDIAISKLGFDGKVRNGPFFAALPILPGAAPQFVIGWNSGASFVASTMPLPHLHQENAEYAGYDAAGRIVHFGSKLPETPATR